MQNSFINGFFLGFSLILAIGAQNSFVIRQGLAKNYIVLVVTFCALADMFLILIGIYGIGFLVEKFFNSFQHLIFMLAAIWIAWYGLAHARYAFKSFDKHFGKFLPKQLTIKQTLSTLIILTFLNPHVYLDTVILLGMVSLQYKELELLAFGCGACFASIIFFCILGFGASAMSSFFNNRLAWRFLDLLISATMFFISFKLMFQSGIIN